MYFHVYSFKLQIHAHIYRSFIRHHKMLGVRIAKRKNEPQKPANPCGTKLRTRIFFGAGKFASQTYPARELKSRGNPAKVSPANIPFLVDNRKCCIFFVNAKHSRQNLRLTIVIRRFCRLLSNYIKTRFIFGYNYILADASKQI